MHKVFLDYFLKSIVFLHPNYWHCKTQMFRSVVYKTMPLYILRALYQGI